MLKVVKKIADKTQVGTLKGHLNPGRLWEIGCKNDEKRSYISCIQMLEHKREMRKMFWEVKDRKGLHRVIFQEN